MLKLSKTEIHSFCGDIVSLRVESDCDEIFCASTDDTVACMKELGKGKYLVILDGVGNAQITVKAGEEVSSCNVSVREMKKADPDGKFKIYVGDTHAHTSYSDGLGTPYDVFKKVSEEDYFKFFTVTDHTELLDDDEFFNTFEAADLYTNKDFIAFGGSESRLDDYYTSSIGDIRSNAGEMVVINKEGYAITDSWDRYFELLGTNKCGLGIIAHPQIQDYRGVQALCNSFDPEYHTNEKSLELIHGIETLNETGDCNLINDRAYSLYLDCGYKISTYGASDHHGPRWGKIAQTCRTFVYAQGDKKEDFLDAMINARTYSCENGNVKLFYTVNGKNPSTTLPMTDTYVFQIHAEPFYVRKRDDDTVFVEVISDHGEVVASRNVGVLEFDFEITVKSDTARYFYLKLYSRIGEATWSSPVWTGREFDKLPKVKFNKPALNDKDFKAKAWSGGKNVGGILSADIKDYVQLNDPDGEIIIDMGKMRRLSAIGYYANMPERRKRETTACFMSRYEYSVSNDCLNFTKVASGRILLYGNEHIAEFEPVEARYVKIRSVSTVGSESRIESLKNIGVAMGALRFY